MICKLSRSHLFSRALVLAFIALTMIALPVSAQSQTEPTWYDPAIHIWREGMTPQGNMHSNVVMGTFPTKDGDTVGQVQMPMFNSNGILAQELESGSLFVPKRLA